MKKISVDEMLNGKENKYPLAVAVAKRAREITDNIILEGKVVEEKAVNMAIEDFKNHKYSIIEPD
ncbi:MAG: DNA-directed RNA polymerase subunit omega [Clostridia bacterium]|nr:DNA-directed RNA polymerase subunit omega [Clostridia bacterium]